MHWRHRLGSTDGGASPVRNEYASLSHTTRPSAALTTQGVNAPINPRSASAKFAVLSSGSRRFWCADSMTAVGGLWSTGPTLPSIRLTGKCLQKWGLAPSTGSLIFREFTNHGPSKAAYFRNGPSTSMGRHNNIRRPGETFGNGRCSSDGDLRRRSVWLFEQQVLDERLWLLVRSEHRCGGRLERHFDSEGHHRRQRPERRGHRRLHHRGRQRQHRRRRGTNRHRRRAD